MKISTSFFCLFSFLVSSFVMSAENKGLFGRVLASATQTTSSMISSTLKAANPLPYALDPNNVSCYNNTEVALKNITMAEFQKNTKLQSDLRSISSQGKRWRHCAIDALIAGDTKTLLAICKVNPITSDPLFFPLISRHFKEQNQDVNKIFSLTPAPAEEATKLIHSIDIERLEKTQQFSMELLKAINTNNVGALEDILREHREYLPEWGILAANNYLTRMHATTLAAAALISPQMTPKPVDSVPVEPLHTIPTTTQETQTPNVPQIILATSSKTEVNVTVAAPSTPQANQVTTVPTQGTQTTNQTRQGGKKTGPVIKQHGTQQLQ